MTSRGNLVSSALLGMLAVLAPANGDAPGVNKDLAANAALYYWQAIQMLPKLDAEKEKLVEAWKEGPPPAEIQKLFDEPTSGSWPASLKQALLQLHRGAKQPHCEWGLDYEQGIEMLMPHLQETRMLARWACRRARVHFEAGRHQAGVNDIIAAMTLARHVGSDPILISILVQYAIEHVAINEVSPYLPKMDAAAIKDLAGRLETLPTETSLKRAILAAEKNISIQLVKRLKAMDENKPDELLKFSFHVVGDTDEMKKRILEHVGNPPSREKVIKLLEAMEPYYDEMADLMEVPWKEWPAKYAAFKEKVHKASAANLFIEMLLPSLDKVRAAEARIIAMRALLKAGIAVVQGGPEKLKHHPDPYGNGPFQYRALENGFELKSALKGADKVIPTITVGQRKKN